MNLRAINDKRFKSHISFFFTIPCVTNFLIARKIWRNLAVLRIRERLLRSSTPTVNLLNCLEGLSYRQNASRRVSFHSWIFETYDCRVLSSVKKKKKKKEIGRELSSRSKRDWPWVITWTLTEISLSPGGRSFSFNSSRNDVTSSATRFHRYARLMAEHRVVGFPTG